jgi:D-beta-D-heptose 7-phosphate kinase/D-beta-D-heptose 1-phosphate adenosyltransferase
MKIWSNGCFDLFHYGHLKLLEFASQQGEELFVGIDSDYKIKQKKGNNRPIIPQEQRIEIIKNLKFVNKVFVYDSNEELENTIRLVKPDRIVIGDDYKYQDVVGEKYAKEIIFFPKLDGISTSLIENKIINMYNK